VFTATFTIAVTIIEIDEKMTLCKAITTIVSHIKLKAQNR